MRYVNKIAYFCKIIRHSSMVGAHGKNVFRPKFIGLSLCRIE